MSDVVEFLKVQVKYDQDLAEAALAVDPAPWIANTGANDSTNQRSGAGAGLVIAADGIALWDCEGSNTLCMTAPSATHVALHNPARVLREAKAKREIIEQYKAAAAEAQRETRHEPGWVADAKCDALAVVLDLIATAYADRPGYGSWLA